jgi:hypothetical protein
VGAGLPRTATLSLKYGLERLLGGRCYHMHEVFGHLEDVPVWRAAIQGDEPDWGAFPPECVAAVDWPASAFWRELAEENPGASIILSTRASAQAWWESVDETILGVARKSALPEYGDWLDMFRELLVREIGEDWDEPELAMAFYERHNAEVRATAPTYRLVDWTPRDGWTPLCEALNVPVPEEPFPHVNTREEWGAAQ